MRVLITLFLAGHGLVHGIMWALPFSEEARADLPMDPAHSWLFGNVRSAAFVAALVVAAAFLVAAGSYAFDARWWPWALIVATGLSVLLLGVFFSRWWFIGFGIDAVLLFAAVRTLAST